MVKISDETVLEFNWRKLKEMQDELHKQIMSEARNTMDRRRAEDWKAFWEMAEHQLGLSLTPDKTGDYTMTMELLQFLMQKAFSSGYVYGCQATLDILEDKVELDKIGKEGLH